MTEYKTSKAYCQSMIKGVCDHCGGEIVPLETVDNSGNPTYWAGCESCSIFCSGVSKEVFEIAKRMVIEEHYKPYSHMNSPDGKDDNYKKYFEGCQISGACSTVYMVDKFRKQITAEKST